ASNERIRRYRKTVTRIKNEQKGNTLGNRVTSEGNTPGNNEGNTPGNNEGNSIALYDDSSDVSKEARVEQFIASHGAMMTLD
ncbi:RNA polymerase subunit sigma-70, partial [Escherichia coli]|nr:RNA polymerase subunit sigma-70 [Escherichia coli]